jgi:hypothetical protein
VAGSCEHGNKLFFASHNRVEVLNLPVSHSRCCLVWAKKWSLNTKFHRNPVVQDEVGVSGLQVRRDAKHYGIAHVTHSCQKCLQPRRPLLASSSPRPQTAHKPLRVLEVLPCSAPLLPTGADIGGGPSHLSKPTRRLIAGATCSSIRTVKGSGEKKDSYKAEHSRSFLYLSQFQDIERARHLRDYNLKQGELRHLICFCHFTLHQWLKSGCIKKTRKHSLYL